MEEHSSEEEGDDDGSSAYHADDADHGIIVTEGIEIDKIGSSEEKGDEDDTGIPSKRCGAMTVGIPQEDEHEEHHEELVDVVPSLYGHLVESHTCGCRGHKVTIIEAADGSENVCEDDKSDPFVMFEVDSFFLAASTHEVEGDDGDCNTCPLPRVEVLAHEGQSSDEHHNRAGGIDGAYNSNG